MESLGFTAQRTRQSVVILLISLVVSCINTVDAVAIIRCGMLRFKGHPVHVATNKRNSCQQLRPFSVVLVGGLDADTSTCTIPNILVVSILLPFLHSVLKQQVSRKP